jgi:hypothetical protein
MRRLRARKPSDRVISEQVDRVQDSVWWKVAPRVHLRRPSAPSAAGVCRLMRGGLSAREENTQIDELAAFYAERTDVRHPFNPFGDSPLRTRAAVREHFAAGGPPANVERYDVIDDHFYARFTARISVARGAARAAA